MAKIYKYKLRDVDSKVLLLYKTKHKREIRYISMNET